MLTVTFKSCITAELSPPPPPPKKKKKKKKKKKSLITSRPGQEQGRPGPEVLNLYSRSAEHEISTFHKH